MNHAHIRPLILGYVRLRLLASDVDVAATREQLNVFAHREGYSLEMVFFERAHSAPAAFEALIESARADHGSKSSRPHRHATLPQQPPLTLKGQLEGDAGHD